MQVTRIVFWTVLIALLAGCASLGASREEALRRRVTAFWDARLAGDLVTQYDYEAASRTGKTTLQKYVSSKGGIRYLSYRIEAIRFPEPGRAEVDLVLKYLVPPVITKPVEARITQNWVLIDGQWYHQEKRRRPKKPAKPSA